MASWGECVTAMAGFYQNNIHTYQGHIKGQSTPVKTNAWILCPLIGGSVRDDCSGFVSACLQLAGVFPKGTLTSSLGFSSTTGRIADLLKKGGFQPIPYSESALQPGDIYSGNNGKFHHVEICAGKGKTYSWGNVHDVAHGGMPSGIYRGAYSVIWRLGANAGDFTMVGGSTVFGAGAILKYEVPRSEQEDHILMTELLNIKTNLIKEILESYGLIFDESEQKINAVKRIETLLQYKINIGKTLNRVNKDIPLLTSSTKHTIEFGKIQHKTYDDINTMLAFNKLKPKNNVKIQYQNILSEGDTSISESIALNAVELGIFPPGTFMGGEIDLTTLSGNGLTLSGNAEQNKNIFMSVLNKFASAVGLKNNSALAIILGQVMHESGSFKYMAEIGAGKGRKYGQPAGPYNKIYYGRGPIQVTWYDNYKKIYEDFFKPNGLAQYNIVANPDLANDPTIASYLTLGWFLTTSNGKRAIAAANAGDIKACTKAINGGFNGLADRIKKTAAIASAMGVNVNLPQA